MLDSYEDTTVPNNVIGLVAGQSMAQAGIALPEYELDEGWVIKEFRDEDGNPLTEAQLRSTRINENRTFTIVLYQPIIDVRVPAIWHPIDKDTNQVIEGLNPKPTYPDMYRRPEVARLNDAGVYEIDYMGVPKPESPGSWSGNNFMYVSNLFFTDQFHRIVAQAYGTYEIDRVSSVRKLVYGTHTAESLPPNTGLHGMGKAPYQEGETMHLYIATKTDQSLSEPEFSPGEVVITALDDDAAARAKLKGHIQKIETYDLSDERPVQKIDWDLANNLNSMFLFKYDADGISGSFLADNPEAPYPYNNYMTQTLQGLAPGKYEAVFPLYWGQNIPQVMSAPDKFSRNRYKVDDTVHFTFEVGVSATKTWVGGAVTDHTKANGKLSLYRAVGSGEPVKMDPQPALSVEEVSGATNKTFKYTWTGLTATDANGNEYAYQPVEEGVTGDKRVINGNTYIASQIGNDITNTYQPPKPATAALSIRKNYGGPALTGTEAFTFQLLSEDKNTVLDTRTATTAGVIAFNDLEFSAPGTYTFHIKEVKGSAPGVTYDDSVYTLTYAVLLDSDTNELGANLAEVKKNNTAISQAAPLVFENSYEDPAPPRPTAAPSPTPTQQPEPPRPTAAPVPPTPTYPTLHVPLSVHKVLKNGALKAGAFTFELQNGAGEKEYVTNLADGTVAFPDRTFSKVVSNYLYTIRELPGTDDKMVYDDTVYTVKVTTRAVNGQLEATVNVEKNGTPYAGPMVFTNQRKLPPTGDSTYTTLALLLGASLLLMGGAYMVSRKRKGHDAA